MGKNGTLAVLLLLFLIFADGSNASLLTKLRMLVAVVPKDDSHTVHVSPSPSPVPLAQIDAKQAPNKTSAEDNHPSSEDNHSKVADSKGLSNTNNANNSNNNKSNNTTGTVGPSEDNQTEGDENRKINKDDDNSKSRDGQPKVGENCTEVPRRCTDRGSLVACILNFDNGTKQVEVLVQNKGEGTLRVNLRSSNPVDDAWLEVSGHETKKINLSLGNQNEVKLDALNGECILHLDPPTSLGNFYLRFPSYDQLITPINGAYFLIVTVVILAGTWACCFFRNRRRQVGIAYQELQMSAPESGLANNRETADGWDQDWDDDWDEENAVRSPGLRHGASISANGLTARSANKDG